MRYFLDIMRYNQGLTLIEPKKPLKVERGKRRGRHSKQSEIKFGRNDLF